MATARAYFDYAATTPMDPRVSEGLCTDLAEALNPSSIHQSGQRARRLLEDARERLGSLIGANPGDIIFTSGATEAANLALRGFVDSTDRPPRVASSAIEHSCVRDTVQTLAEAGRAEVIELSVQSDGRVDLPDAPVDLLCLMHSNNETGVVQDVQMAQQWRRSTGAVWLCDASQSLGKLPIYCEELGADLVVFSSHKIYGPPGAGCLVGPLVHRLVSQLTGGPHEHERRAGTPPVALIRAFVHAAELAVGEQQERAERLRELETRLLERLSARGVAFLRNGEGECLPGFLNLSFAGFEGTDLTIALDQRGIDVSPGSACSTGVVSVSPVLEAMFPLDSERAAAGLRITMGHKTSEAEVDRLADALRDLVVPT
ncbi:cysteine desulfurase [bacterium]|nr:cysteine desulfurase [bacterium]